MRAKFRPLICAALLSLSGCPHIAPQGHDRPLGHQDTTIDISPSDDAILFNATGTGGRDLYLLRLADLTVVRIADTPEYEVAPSFSPDGETIVYAAGVRGDRADHVFTIDRNGSGRTQLTNADANDTAPRFSPDGSLIVFARDKTYNWGGLAASWGTGGVICLIDTDGTNLRQLTPDEEFAHEPYFSLDGTHIVYSTLNGRMSIPVDGSAKSRPIAGPPGAVSSHDGNSIAYSKGRYAHEVRIHIAKADATSAHVLTPDIGGCNRPVFSHADDRLFFLHEEWPDGGTGVPKFSLWEAAVDGASVRMVVDRSLFDDPLRWKPQLSR